MGVDVAILGRRKQRMAAVVAVEYSERYDMVIQCGVIALEDARFASPLAHQTGLCFFALSLSFRVNRQPAKVRV
jgi:hypothetical protein